MPAALNFAEQNAMFCAARAVARLRIQRRA
jgi:hypothetical protein